MKFTLDAKDSICIITDCNEERRFPLYSKEAFDAIARWYVKIGWHQRYSYCFSWFGRPLIQLPDDVLRIQELVYRLQPDVIVETGVAHGGSLVLYASLCQALGKGRVIGIDIEIRNVNRSAIESHPLSHRINLIEGSSIEPNVVDQVKDLIVKNEVVLVLLDSNHSYDHVFAELEAYACLVTSGSYIVATDGIMEDLADVPNGDPSWAYDNPARAARDFAARRDDFILEEPSWPYRANALDRSPVSYWPSAYLRRV